MAKHEGAEVNAKQAWCDEAAAQITAELATFLSPEPDARGKVVAPENKEEVLRQVQNWIIKERKTLKPKKPAKRRKS